MGASGRTSSSCRMQCGCAAGIRVCPPCWVLAAPSGLWAVPRPESPVCRGAARMPNECGSAHPAGRAQPGSVGTSLSGVDRGSCGSGLRLGARATSPCVCRTNLRPPSVQGGHGPVRWAHRCRGWWPGQLRSGLRLGARAGSPCVCRTILRLPSLQGGHGRIRWAHRCRGWWPVQLRSGLRLGARTTSPCVCRTNLRLPSLQGGHGPVRWADGCRGTEVLVVPGVLCGCAAGMRVCPPCWVLAAPSGLWAVPRPESSACRVQPGVPNECGSAHPAGWAQPGSVGTSLSGVDRGSCGRGFVWVPARRRRACAARICVRRACRVGTARFGGHTGVGGGGRGSCGRGFVWVLAPGRRACTARFCVCRACRVGTAGFGGLIRRTGRDRPAPCRSAGATNRPSPAARSQRNEVVRQLSGDRSPGRELRCEGPVRPGG